MRRVLLDRGFLVALAIERGPRHRAARDFLDQYAGELLVPGPVVTESCYFLSTVGKVRLLQWLSKPPRHVLELPVQAYSDVGEILARYADLDPDFTDAALVWVAHDSSCRRILTVDRKDFSTYRLKGNRRFDVLPWD